LRYFGLDEERIGVALSVVLDKNSRSLVVPIVRDKIPRRLRQQALIMVSLEFVSSGKNNH
jgi:hypothetical protein